MTIGTRDYPLGPETEYGPYTITSTSDRIDFRASGRQATVKFASVSDANTYWRLGEIRLEVQPAGTRR